MNRRINKRLGKKLAILTSLAAVTVFIGHGCSNFSGSSSTGNSATSVGSIPSNGGMPDNTPGYQPMPGANTVSLVYNKQLLDNMVACAGTGTPSPEALAEWQNRQSSFSEYGYALDVTAPMLMAVTAVAGEICDDLLNIETAQPIGSRRLFNSWDFTQGPSALTQASIADSARRFALSCWARELLPALTDATGTYEDEGKIYQDAMTEATESPSDPAQTRKLALIMCTGALASLSGITL